MHRTLVFDSSWKNEWKFNSDDNPIAPGAKELAQEIVKVLKRKVSGISDVSQHSHYGWGFSTEFDDVSFYQVLNPVDAVYLTVKMESYFLKVLLLQRPKASFERYCVFLEEALGEVQGISNLRWEQK
jgi:hypothetical protein